MKKSMGTVELPLQPILKERPHPLRRHIKRDRQAPPDPRPVDPLDQLRQGEPIIGSLIHPQPSPDARVDVLVVEIDANAGMGVVIGPPRSVR